MKCSECKSSLSNKFCLPCSECSSRPHELCCSDKFEPAKKQPMSCVEAFQDRYQIGLFDSDHKSCFDEGWRLATDNTHLVYSDYVKEVQGLLLNFKRMFATTETTQRVENINKFMGIIEKQKEDNERK